MDVRVFTLGGAIVLALVLGVALGLREEPIPPPPPAQEQYERDSTYLTVVRGHDIDGTDGELLTTARNVCAYVYQGRSLGELVSYAQRRHRLDEDGATFLVGVAVHTQCPERIDVLGPVGV